MKMMLMIISVLLFGSMSYAETTCTTKSRELWMKSDVFKKQLENEGHKIKVFKTLETCYYVYGVDKDGKKLDQHYDPTDGRPVQAAPKTGKK